MDWNGIWQRQYDNQKIFYCIKSEIVILSGITLCKLTEQRTNTEFYSTDSPSQSIHYLYTLGSDIDISIQIIGKLKSQNEISWRQNQIEIFTWLRAGNLYPTNSDHQKYDFYHNLNLQEITLKLDYFKWYRFGERPAYSSEYETCPNDYVASMQWFTNPPFAGYNNTVIDVINAETGQSILKSVNNGVIHDSNTIQARSMLEFRALPIRLDWFTSSNIYIMLKYKFNQQVLTFPALTGITTNPCFDINIARCAQIEGVSSPIKLLFVSTNDDIKSCSIGFDTIIDNDYGHCDGNQYQSYFPLGFRDKYLNWDKVILPIQPFINNLCPSFTKLYQIPNHLLSPTIDLESKQCGIQMSSMLTAPHCIININSPSPSGSGPAPAPAPPPLYFQNEYQHHWKVKMVLNNKGCIGIKDSGNLLRSQQESSLFVDPQCGVPTSRNAMGYLSPYFIIKFVDNSDPNKHG